MVTRPSVSKNDLASQTNSVSVIIPYVVLCVSTLAAWFPVLGGHPLFSEEFHYRNMFNNGIYGFFKGWLEFQGVWRLLSQAVNGYTTNHPAFSSYLAVATHLITVCLFFRVSQILFKRTGLAIILALAMGIFPWGYQTLVNVMGYTPILATTIFWGNILLLVCYAENRKAQPYVSLASFFLAFIAQSLYEILVFAFMFSGVIVWINTDVSQFNRKTIAQNIWENVKYKYSGFAPLLGSLSFLILYKLTYPVNNRMYPPGFNIKSIFSTFYYQYTNYYVLEPWLHSTTRNLMLFSWTLVDILTFGGLLCIFIIALPILIKQQHFGAIKLSKPKLSKLNPNLFYYIILLMLGASLLYAVAGGYTFDTRKRYSLIPILLLFFGWVWCRFFEKRVRLSKRLLALLMTLGFFGVSSSWLVTGVYLYEINRQDALAEFIVANNIKGDINLDLNPDITTAWSKFYWTLGFNMYDNWVFNFSPESKLGLWNNRPLADTVWYLHEGERLVTITNSNKALKIRFNPRASRWQIVENKVE